MPGRFKNERSEVDMIVRKDRFTLKASLMTRLMDIPNYHR